MKELKRPGFPYKYNNSKYLSSNMSFQLSYTPYKNNR